jgi:hypothetical protein
MACVNPRAASLSRKARMQTPLRSSSPENSTPTHAPGRAASASSIAAIEPFVSAAPRPCRRSPRRTSMCGGDE